MLFHQIIINIIILVIFYVIIITTITFEQYFMKLYIIRFILSS